MNELHTEDGVVLPDGSIEPYDGDVTGGTGDYSAMASYAREEYGPNVGRFIEDHPDWVVMAGFEGVGYSARRRDDRGRGAGSSESALTLDELAARLAEHRGQA